VNENIRRDSETQVNPLLKEKEKERGKHR